MPQWLVIGLVVLFAAHLAAFVRLALVRGERYYWLVSLLFLALTASFGVRWQAPGLMLGEWRVHQLLRYGAWSLALVTIPLLVRRMWNRWASRSGSTGS